ncbi:hypothetical protein BGW39_010579 [Mortierella sp. 14UC]|nr:hypothetical protein BGW39_010579 [Mortierella sp. 14UC]
MGRVITNVFSFEVLYRTAQRNYYNVIVREGSAGDGEQEMCHSDGVWCIKYSGWGTRDEKLITFRYANLEFVIPNPYEIKTGASIRNTYLYMSNVDG